ncbi:hypothetical protein ACIRG5_45800 [Lentzea sp. NPDC102401]|uniref:hypothetical protein n=1 Tax=Lentzea sp. NPDC102401 TaxID=3364128 RepID=UPI00381A163A
MPGPQLAQILSLQDTDVEKLSVVGVDLQHCMFVGALNLDKLSLSGPITFAQLPHDGFRTWWNWPFVWRWSRREVIREEFFWRAELPRLMPLSWSDRRVVAKARFLSYSMARGKYLAFWLNAAGTAGSSPSASTRSRLLTGDHLASLYRSLRKAREDAKDEPGAGDFYYGEMEARRLSRPPMSADRWLLTLYWALSGYGQRASRALAALVALLATLTVLPPGTASPTPRPSSASPIPRAPPLPHYRR